MRAPLVAGQFYEGTKEKLIEQIEESFRKGDTFPSEKRDKRVIAAIVPHAGYVFSGKAAAQAVKEIAESDAEVFVILGVNHQGSGKNTTTDEDFLTPLGTAKIDKELLAILKRDCGLEVNEEAHRHEHSMEVILPMLQYAVKKFAFVPLMVSFDPENLGRALRKGVEEYTKKTKKKVCVIASADMTHFGMSYGFMPFSENIRERLYSLDRGAIELILKKDAKGFLNYIEETKATICGRNTIASLLSYLEKERVKGELLDYYTSADVMGDHRTAVGYAAIVFRPS